MKQSIYDPSLIESYAAALYKQAESLVVRAQFLSFIVGSLVSLLLFVGGTVQADKVGERILPIPALIGAAAFTAVLYAVWVGAAQRRAFALKLQAQTALCQLQIEINTRPTT